MQRPHPSAGPGPRPEIWIPVLYAAAAGAWITFSDLALTAFASSMGEQALVSLLKGFGFVAVTALLLHAFLRKAFARERTTRRDLEESEALLRAITDAIPDPVFMKDRESRWLFANPATLKVIGRRLADVIGRNDREIYDDPAVGEALMEIDRRIMDSGTTETVEETIQTPSGYRTYLSSKAPHRDREGRVVGIVGSARDITERKKAEEALRGRLALEDQVSRIADAVPGLICSFLLRPDGTACMPFTTSALSEVFGISQEEAARDFASVARNVHPDDLPRLMDGVRASARAMTRWHDSFRYHHPSKGPRWIEGWSVPRAEPDGSVLWHGYVVDVTERRRLEEQLQQSQKLEGIGRLAGGVAHDFNNLLTVILSCAEDLEEAARRRDPASAEEVSELRSAAERARDLTRQLLAVARRQVIAPVILDLNQVVAGSERLLRRTLGEDVDLRVELEPGLPSIRGDAGQLEQVILNLAVNARDAMPGGGTLSIATRTLDVPSPAAAGADPACRDPAAGPWICLAVRDSGSGMAPEVKEHLFEPFFTTKPRGEGSGLGLAIVYGIVSQNGGCVRVESEQGRGTSVEVLLPHADGVPLPPPPPARVPSRTPGRGGETILVVEDDAAVRDVTVRALRSAGYRVLAAGGGREALALDDGQLRAVDLLVTDVVMPGLDGAAIAEALRRRSPRLRVLYVSGYTRDGIAARGVVDPGVDLLPKPFTPSTLLARVRAALDGRADAPRPEPPGSAG